MAFQAPIDFARPSSQLSLGRKPTASFLDDFDTAEDPSFMDSSTIMSPALTTTEDRRDSFGHSAPVYSPQNNAWDEFSGTTTMPERPFVSTAGNPFFPEQSHNPFRRGDNSAFTQQHNQQWPMFDQGHDSRSTIVPHAAFEPFGGDYDATPASAFSHSNPFDPMPSNAVRPASVFPQASTPTALSASSPPAGGDWMSLADQAHIDSRTIPKRLRGQSPARYPPNYRNDNGIRKKNARFEIPADRNLANIDHLIHSSKNDDEIKELKQQKRLLRNRQAALDSRQRKKQRAEELEDENKRLRDQISALHDDLQSLKFENEQVSMEKNDLLHESSELQQRLQQSEWDKENIVVENTKETSDLRKKIQVLQEIVETKDMPNNHRSDTGHYEFSMSNDLGGLSVDSLDMDQWPDPFGDFIMDQSDAPQPIARPLETSLVLAPKKRMQEEQEDKSQPSGLFMLLLLCGAWVASKASTSMPVTIPRMPEKVVSDAAVVFDDLMKDHGVATFQADVIVEPVPSNRANVKQIAFAMPDSTPTHSKLDQMHSHLTRPSKQQEREDAFSLSAKQYDSYTSTDFAERVYNTPPEDDSSASSPSYRRHLVDSLKAMREDRGHTANVYTRSLLWDRIPDNVVQEFKRMAEQTSQTSDGDGGCPQD